MTPSTQPFKAFCLLATLLMAPYAQAKATTYISGTSIDGITSQLAVDRTPALYTHDFGDCLGGQSLFNVTKFDAAYYADNSTVLFHLDGTSNIKNESLMMVITMDAYGENRFDMTFDPCFVNIYSLCPLNASVPITAWAYFQVGKMQVGDIPDIALTIPDFEGFVRMQIFANSSKTEIGCFQAVMTNGASMGHPEAIAPVLGAFTLVAIIASFATAAYGVNVPHMRTHYAHSISVLVIFETFHSIFLSGALSLNWPSILIAWWSNFAWSAGQIHSSSMVDSVDSFAGVNGNSSQAGGAGTTIINNGGGLAQSIYGRSVFSEALPQLTRRQPYNASDPYDYTWAGSPVKPGMPLPGLTASFQGTLSAVSIPAADAFIFGLIWLLVLVALLVLALTVFKFSLEALVKMKRIKEDRLAYFRGHWANYIILVVLRTLFIAFFFMMTLTMYQFSIAGSAGAKAIAAIIFLLFLVGVGGLVTYACRFRLRYGSYAVEPDRVVFTRGTIFKVVPCVAPVLSSSLKETELPQRPIGSMPFMRIQYIDNDPSRATVHQDQPYIERFGWLTARYRRSRWWFSGCYLLYQLIRAAFVGGASATPLAQVYGLLVYDILTFIVFVKLDPFEGRRNTALAVWMLGLSKILTTGLSIAFLPAMNLNRIIATVIGVIIIVIQGFLVIGLMILVVLGAISSWMSLTRNQEDFSPDFLESIRYRYFENLQDKAPDVYVSREEKKRILRAKKAEAEIQIPQEPYFSVNEVRRAPKIEDEDDDVVADLETSQIESGVFDPTRRIRNRASRSSSVGSRMSTSSLPRAARVHRASWSSRDFAEWDALQRDRAESGLVKRLGSHGGLDASNIAESGNATTPSGTNMENPFSSLRSRPHRRVPSRGTLLDTTLEVRTPTTPGPVHTMTESPVGMTESPTTIEFPAYQEAAVGGEMLATEAADKHMKEGDQEGDQNKPAH